MVKFNQWEKFRDYINATEIDSNITRKELLLHVYEDPKEWKLYSRMSTMDGYRLALCRLGILESVKRGVYKVKHHIRADIPFQRIKDRAYRPRDWREWFIPVEDDQKRKGLLL